MSSTGWAREGVESFEGVLGDTQHTHTHTHSLTLSLSLSLSDILKGVSTVQSPLLYITYDVLPVHPSFSLYYQSRC